MWVGDWSPLTKGILEFSSPKFDKVRGKAVSIEHFRKARIEDGVLYGIWRREIRQRPGFAED